MASNRKNLKYLRITDVPMSVWADFEKSARSFDIPNNQAVSMILVGADLHAAHREGLNRMPLCSSEAVTKFGVHITPELKAKLLKVAKDNGGQIGAAGRLILVGLAGKIAETIQAGFAATAASKGKP